MSRVGVVSHDLVAAENVDEYRVRVHLAGKAWVRTWVSGLLLAELGETFI